MQPKIQIALYRGHTHGEIAILPNAPIGSYLGNWCRNTLAEKEFIPEGRRWNKQLGKLEFVHRHWELTKMYCTYDYKTNRMHLPIAFCDEAKKLLEDLGAEVKELLLPDYPLRKMDVKMNPSMSDRPWQVDLIKKCSEEARGMKGLCMQTGKGKTYAAIKSAVNLGYATMIICPGLVDQWIKNLMEYTSAKIGTIYKITGFESIARLAQNPTFKPSIFVASVRTMQMFSECEEGYELLPWTYEGFYKEYGIGTKIIDECHKQFHAHTLMDLKTNVPYDLYCSATFDQTNRFAKEVFDRVFPKSIRYGFAEYDKYVTVVFYNFSGEVAERRCTNAKGYSHVKYEQDLLKSGQKLDSHINQMFLPIINQYYINVKKDGQKGLIFCASIEFVNAVADRLKKAYPDLKVVTYLGGDEQSVLDNADLIVSTGQKAGTGTDIKNLIFCYNTVSIKTPVLNAQLLGRLRKINGVELTYVDRCDTNLAAHVRHAETRKMELRNMALKYYEYNGLTDTSIQSGQPSLFSTQLFN